MMNTQTAQTDDRREAMLAAMLRDGVGTPVERSRMKVELRRIRSRRANRALRSAMGPAGS